VSCPEDGKEEKDDTDERVAEGAEAVEGILAGSVGISVTFSDCESRGKAGSPYSI
jgi:hypothetical protein